MYISPYYAPADLRIAARRVLRTRRRFLDIAQNMLRLSSGGNPVQHEPDRERVFEIVAAIQAITDHDDLDLALLLSLRDLPLNDVEAFAIMGAGLSVAEVAARTAQNTLGTGPWWPTLADTQTHRTMAALRGFPVLATDELYVSPF